MLISGEVMGNVLAAERIELPGTAQVFGDIEVPAHSSETSAPREGRDLSVVNLKR